mgnify:CR=1 FL=1
MDIRPDRACFRAWALRSFPQTLPRLGIGTLVLVALAGCQSMRPPETETETAPSHGSARRPGGGLGIGLPLVGALALANGARIDISSEPMHGTKVAVVFGKDRAVPK